MLDLQLQTYVRYTITNLWKIYNYKLMLDIQLQSNEGAEGL